MPAGQDSLADGTWSETAGGGDIWGVADAFHLVSESLTGDGSVSVDVAAQQAVSPWSKAGPMIRATNDPGSPYFAALVTPGNGIAVQWRSTQAGTTRQLIVPGTVPTYLEVARYTDPATGDVYYTAYTSPDGVNWTAIAGSTQQITLGPGPLLAGLALTSHDQGTAGAVTLTSVDVSSTEPALPPGLCPDGWTCQDIGGPLPAGGQTIAAGEWTVSGGGGDIWGTADAFHLVAEPLAGDGTLSAEVTSVSSQLQPSPWAKAGIMLRLTDGPGSPYYAALQTEGKGTVVQYRDTRGDVSTQPVDVAGGAPIYLAISRSGTTFSAATSTDGVTWTPLAGSTVSLPALTGSLLAGVAVTSHHQDYLSSASLTAVDVTPAP